MWYLRDLSSQLQNLRPNTVGILSGPRQSGKTALLLKQFSPEARLIECDDLSMRTRLNQEPSLILGDLKTPVIIDEAHYCPMIFPELKLRVDRAKRNQTSLPQIWITGSNQTLMDGSVRETLAGRSQYFALNTLSIHELGKTFQIRDFFMRGGWPALNADPSIDPVSYLDDYIRTFVERDIALASGVTKLEEFLRAIQLMAARTAYTVNMQKLGGEIGVKGDTFQNWVQILERNGIVTLVPAFSNNLNKRLIKMPKFYFNDVALATRLQGWRSIDPLIVSPIVGNLFETAVFTELLRCRDHLGLGLDFFHYRTKENEEVDFIIQGQSKTKGPLQLAVEVKFAQQGAPHVIWPKKLDADLKQGSQKWVVTLNSERHHDSNHVLYLSICDLAQELIKWLG
jgi:uncharacterized protein